MDITKNNIIDLNEFRKSKEVKSTDINSGNKYKQKIKKMKKEELLYIESLLEDNDD